MQHRARHIGSYSMVNGSKRFHGVSIYSYGWPPYCLSIFSIQSHLWFFISHCIIECCTHFIIIYILPNVHICSKFSIPLKLSYSCYNFNNICNTERNHSSFNTSEFILVKDGSHILILKPNAQFLQPTISHLLYIFVCRSLK